MSDASIVKKLSRGYASGGPVRLLSILCVVSWRSHQYIILLDGWVDRDERMALSGWTWDHGSEWIVMNFLGYESILCRAKIAAAKLDSKMEEDKLKAELKEEQDSILRVSCCHA